MNTTTNVVLALGLAAIFYLVNKGQARDRYAAAAAAAGTTLTGWPQRRAAAAQAAAAASLRASQGRLWRSTAMVFALTAAVLCALQYFLPDVGGKAGKGAKGKAGKAVGKAGKGAKMSGGGGGYLVGGESAYGSSPDLYNHLYGR